MSTAAPCRFARLRGEGPAARWTLIIGGALWIVHGYLRFIPPAGTDVVFRPELGYAVVIRSDLFVVYNVTGVLALLLTSGGTLLLLSTLSAGHRGWRRAARIVAVVAVFLGLLALMGLLLMFDPLTTAGLDLGEPVLGAALALAGLAEVLDGSSSGHPRWRGPLLIVTGAIGMAMLPLRPAIYALGLLPIEAGVLGLALFGVGCILVGATVRSHSTRPGRTASESALPSA
ncbi:hypothetical protein [Agromyces sp. NPDC057865]|uniref:hypothetical protein n=1 Tax=Agromyces sp. NPDC057865 TaxID=3346267 RepID=UPI00366E4351